MNKSYACIWISLCECMCNTLCVFEHRREPGATETEIFAVIISSYLLTHCSQSTHLSHLRWVVTKGIQYRYSHFVPQGIKADLLFGVGIILAIMQMRKGFRELCNLGHTAEFSFYCCYDAYCRQLAASRMKVKVKQKALRDLPSLASFRACIVKLGSEPPQRRNRTVRYPHLPSRSLQGSRWAALCDLEACLSHPEKLSQGICLWCTYWGGPSSPHRPHPLLLLGNALG